MPFSVLLLKELLNRINCVDAAAGCLVLPYQPISRPNNVDTIQIENN